MTWVLKARQPDSCFLYRDEAGQLSISAACDSALRFDSHEEAKSFLEGITADEGAEAWRNRSPQLLPVQLGVRSFIVPAWAGIFGFLGRLSFFWLVRKLFPRVTRTYVFVDIWVLFWGVVALISLLTMAYWRTTPRGFTFFIALVGILRVAEIVIYQINVVLLDEWRATQNPNGPPYAVRSYRRLVILTLHNYVEILLWFAMFYIIEAESFYTSGLSLQTLSGAIYHSMLTMTTLGYGDIYPLEDQWRAAVLATAQTLIGVFLAVIVVARVIALIPKPLTMDEKE